MKVIHFKSDYENTTTKIKVSMGSENISDFDFKMIKYQGDTERGFSGFLELLALQNSIDKMLDYMMEKNPGSVGKVAKRLILNEVDMPAKKSLLADNLNDPEEFDFRQDYSVKVGDLEEEDEIVVAHSTSLTRLSFNEEGAFKQENLKIHAGKWQGDCEKGEEGIYRLFITMKNINKVKMAILEVFPDFNERAEGYLKEPKQEPGSDFQP